MLPVATVLLLVGSGTADFHVPGVCTWVGAGAPRVEAALARPEDDSSVEAAFEDLCEHARLHGWLDTVSWDTERNADLPFVTPAPCADLVVDRLAALDVPECRGPWAGTLFRIADVLARAGRADAARRFLAPSIPTEEWAPAGLPWSEHVLLLAWYLEADGGCWTEALATSDRGPWAVVLYRNPCAFGAELDEGKQAELRARAFAALGRVEETARPLRGFDHTPTCQDVETLLRAARIAGRELGERDLVEHLRLDSLASAAELLLRAERHLALFALAPASLLPHLTDLVEHGHREEARATLRFHGDAAVDVLLEEFRSRDRDDQWECPLLLASTGLPRLQDELAPRSPPSADAFVYGLWEYANGVRQDLEARR